MNGVKPPDILLELAARGINHSLDEVLRLVEKSLLQDEAMRRRSMKGAIGQKAAADERRCRIVAIARQLIAERSRPFTSYRQLAKAVSQNSSVLESEETIRKHLAGAQLIGNESSG